MKVSQLIDVLKELNPDTVIKLSIDEDQNHIYDILQMVFSKDDKEVTLIPDEFGVKSNEKGSLYNN